MKMIKLLTASMLAMLALNVASAQTEIRLTGSTAFRKATVNSIQHVLTAGYVWGSTTGSGLGANQQVFVGTVGSTQVIIKCSWSGSAGGIQSLAENIPAGQPFIIDPVVSSYSTPAATVGGIALTNAGASIPATDITESHTADVALSDAFASTTPFTGAGFAPLTDTIVGIVPFAWVKGAYTPDGTTAHAVAGGYPGVTNISEVQAQELIDGGLAMNQFTSVPADQGIFVQMVGRDHDSGTRIGYIYDTQYGNYHSGVLQNLPDGGATVGATQFAPQSAGTGVIESLSPWPVETVIGETRAAGNEGYFSGGTVASVLNRPCDTSAGNYIISSLGFGDSPSVNPGAGYSYVDGAGNTDTITPSQNCILYNGAYPGTPTHPFGPPYVNVEQGVYTSWGYEHFLTSTLSGPGLTVATAIATQLTSEADYLGVGDLLSNMNASRLGDGKEVTSP
jgi:hypothetical protein